MDVDVDSERGVIANTTMTSPSELGRREVVTTKAYTVEEVADMFKIGRDKVYELLRTGELESIKIGKLRRITDEHLAEFVAALEEKEHDRA